MPIEVKVVSQADFDKWVSDAKTKFAASAPADGPANNNAAQLAAAETAAAAPAKAGN